jgi:hypothetical protein
VTQLWVKNRLPKAWQSHAMGSGGHETDSQPASVLANETQLREKQAKLPDPMMGIKGIIASALADTSQAERIQTFVLSQENQ